MRTNTNPVVLAAKFNNAYTPDEIQKYLDAFQSVDQNETGVNATQAYSIVKQFGNVFSESVVEDAVAEVDRDRDGLVNFEEFLQLIQKSKEISKARLPKKNLNGSFGGSAALGSASKIHNIMGSNANIIHGISEDEKESFTEHINERLANDSDLKGRLPISLEGMTLFQECRDGLVLSKLINNSVPGTIDERVLNKNGSKMNAFLVTENNNLVINSAKAIGCSVVNIGAQDLAEGREHLVLGLIWQIIRIGLNAQIDIRVHPELFRLLEPGETLEDLLKLPPDVILLRWFNYHLKRAGWDRRVQNFSGDIKDAENYAVLLNQLAPNVCSRDPLNEKDVSRRAELVLQNADKLGCRKYVTPKTIVNGNSKLNFAFVANLFNTHPGLEALTAQEMAALDEALFAGEGDREARAFALWMNSLGVDPFVYSIFEDLRDGLVLLQVFDKVHPGLVDWRQVNKVPKIRFKKVENTNYAVVLGKSLKFSLIGIQGADITDGSKTLTLGLVWQMMRDHVIETLKNLSTGQNREIKDHDMIEWANSCVSRTGTGTTSMSSFKDSSLSNGRFFIDLCNGIKKGIVDYSLVTAGESDDDAKLNAKYAISIARKLGATIFVLPEDIIEVRPKMILTFVGSLMAVDRLINSSKN